MLRSEKAANRVMSTITDFIEKKLGLKVNAEKSKIARPNEMDFTRTNRVHGSLNHILNLFKSLLRI